MSFFHPLRPLYSPYSQYPYLFIYMLSTCDAYDLIIWYYIWMRAPLVPFSIWWYVTQDASCNYDSTMCPVGGLSKKISCCQDVLLFLFSYELHINHVINLRWFLCRRCCNDDTFENNILIWYCLILFRFEIYVVPNYRSRNLEFHLYFQWWRPSANLIYFWTN